MNDNNTRRGFLKKASVALSAVFVPVYTGLASKFRKQSKNKSGNKTMSDGIRNIKQLGFQWETSDPFLFCVHHEDFYPEGNEQLGPKGSLAGRNIGSDFEPKDGWRMYHGEKIPGFPAHPHRGFETVTVVRKGMVDHSDSLGASGRYGSGDVQWMTAGKGVQHAEMFPLLNRNSSNTLELFQIWLNLPKAKKFAEPNYKMLWHEKIPVVKEKDKNGKSIEVTVIAGDYNNIKAVSPTPDSWASEKENSVAIWIIKMKKDARWKLPSAAGGLSRTLYFFNGSGLNLNGRNIPEYHAVELQSDKECELIAGADGCDMLLLQGRPINEPVIQYGPFVMNTREEIQQAYADYQRTSFGGWPWKDNDPVHDPKAGRFAKHSDGRIVKPGG